MYVLCLAVGLTINLHVVKEFNKADGGGGGGGGGYKSEGWRKRRGEGQKEIEIEKISDERMCY